MFFTRSEYHSCPEINGVQQHDGSPYGSIQTIFEEWPNNEGIHFQTDIAHAYPSSANVKSWIRSLQFDRTSNTVQLDDRYQLNKYISPQQLHFILNPKVEIEKNEQGFRLYQIDKKVNMFIQFEWQKFDTWKLENRSLDGDFRLERFWGDQIIKRVTLITRAQNKDELQGHFTFLFKV